MDIGGFGSEVPRDLPLTAPRAGKSDPFVIADVDEHQVRTQTLFKNLAPFWGEVSIFVVGLLLGMQSQTFPERLLCCPHRRSRPAFDRLPFPRVSSCH